MIVLRPARPVRQTRCPRTARRAAGAGQTDLDAKGTRQVAAKQDHRLTELLDRLRDTTRSDEVVVKDLVGAIAQGGMIPFLLVPAFLAATPLSGIPGLSAACGLVIVLVSLRMLMNYDTMILPGWIERRSVEGKRLHAVLAKAEPVVTWIESHARRRGAWLFHRPVIWLPQVLCLMSGLMMPFLEFVPFSSSFVAAGVCLLALSMLLRDGIVFLIALTPYTAVIYLAVQSLA